MDIYLIRHTKTNTTNGLCYGQTDVPLATTFSEEARALHVKLPELSKNSVVISSPLQRCLALAKTFQLPVQIDNRLLEINFGEWENLLFDEIDEVLLKTWTENFVSIPPPKGETFGELYRRAGDFWDELVVTTQAEQVFVITHAGVIRALFAHVLQLPLTNAFKFCVDTGSVHLLQYVNQYTYFRYHNR